MRERDGDSEGERGRRERERDTGKKRAMEIVKEREEGGSERDKGREVDME